MKLVKLAAIVAGAGIAQVIAVPLVVLAPPNYVGNTPATNIRFGHAVPMRSDRPGVGQPNMRVPCGGRRPSRFRQKAVEISNIFRQALGLPLIQAGGHPGHGRPDIVQIFPVTTTAPVFSPVIFDKYGNKVEGGVTTFGNPNMPRPRPGFGHIQAVPGLRYDQPQRIHRHHFHQLGKGPFIKRIHYSLMNLGRWEGRAVAFVLGCGIGVLLRMFWVLAIVMYRAVRGQRDEEHEYSQITIIEEVVDTPKSAPPVYTYPVDEKVAVPIITVEAVEAVEAPSTTEESK